MAAACRTLRLPRRGVPSWRRQRSSALAMLSGGAEAAPYAPPRWAAEALSAAPPPEALSLGRLPTPVQELKGVPGWPASTKLLVKRDDLSGLELSGNKIRKLNFLLADAVRQGADCVVTLGGIQSNHCRATCVAARAVGLDAHLVLRTRKSEVEDDPGLVGNLLVERLAGAHVHLVSKEEYVKHGSVALGDALAAKLREEGKKPYVIPVGGSNSLGTWGYLDFIRELEAQLGTGDLPEAVDDIAMACGSGGTSAGVALGVRLAGMSARVHAYGVCDDEEYFYNFIDGILKGLGAPQGLDARSLLICRQAKGAGYAISRSDELEFVRDVALSTGIVFDPVYSGKALKALRDEVAASPAEWEGRTVLFIHTGGLLSMYEKADQMQPLVETLGRAGRFPALDRLQQ